MDKRNLRILIIDDNKDYQLTMGKFLALTGTHMVFSAYTGMDGLVKAAQINPDVILLDMGLPDMCGTEVLGRLYNTPSTNAIPVLIVTGSGLTKKEIGGPAQRNIISVEEKPVKMSAILAKLESVLLPDRTDGDPHAHSNCGR
jgi:two-component system alkaline phosphatase synthesis response regulator PhoP